jgi:predicted nicotinamide N-methyase
MGLCGIVAHLCGASSVVITDGDSNALTGMRDNTKKYSSSRIVEAKNISNNEDEGGGGSGGVECRQLIWGVEGSQAFPSQSYDYVIGSDIIYVEDILEPLFYTVKHLMKPGGQFLLAYARRNVKIDHVFEMAATFGFALKEDEESVVQEGVYIFVLLEE